MKVVTTIVMNHAYYYVSMSDKNTECVWVGVLFDPTILSIFCSFSFFASVFSSFLLFFSMLILPYHFIYGFS